MVQTVVETTEQRPPSQGVVAAMEQRAFRALLDSMARPGTVSQLPAPRAADGVWGGALIVLQCLLDHEVTFCVEAADRYPQEQILRRTGARSAPLGDAGFVLADAEHAAVAIAGAREGDLEEPERSATVVVGVGTVGTGPLGVVLTGPGIATVATLELGGVEVGVLRAIAQRNAAFPTGIDAIFVDPEGRVACLPRSTRIEVGA